jgi:hypothetical protein
VAGDQVKIKCREHSEGIATFICQHLHINPEQLWFSNPPIEEDPWPDAWCSACEALFLEYGEWNEHSEKKREIVAICHHCYAALRSREISVH